MPLYYLHLRDGTDQILDPEGLELNGMEAVRKAVLRGARDTISHDVIADGIVDFRFRIDAENEAGEIVYSLPFTDAVSVIPPPRKSVLVSCREADTRRARPFGGSPGRASNVGSPPIATAHRARAIGEIGNPGRG